MVETSVTLSIPQMVDVALGTPELGTVNFNVLQSLLHVLVQQVDLTTTNVEIRGKEGERIRQIMTGSPPTNKINITEYVVANQEGKKVRKRKRSSITKIKRGSKDDIGLETKMSQETILLVAKSEEGLEAPRFGLAVTKKDFNELTEEIEELKREIHELKDLPGNMGLVEAIRSENKNTPVLDMFQILNLTKRLDATERSVSKMASLIEDVVKEISNGVGGGIDGRGTVGGGTVKKGAIGGGTEGAGSRSNAQAESTGGTDSGSNTSRKKSLIDTEDFKNTVASIKEEHDRESIVKKTSLSAVAKEALKNLEKRVSQIEEVLGMAQEELAKHQGVDEDYNQLVLDINQIRQEIQVITDTLSKINPEEMQKSMKELENIARASEEAKAQAAAVARASASGSKVSAVPSIKATTAPPPVGSTPKGIFVTPPPAGSELGGPEGISINSSVHGERGKVSGPLGTTDVLRINALENKILECTQNLQSMDNQYGTELNSLKSQFVDMEKVFNAILERINIAIPTDHGDQQDVDTTELYNKTMALQADMENISDIANKLLLDKEEKRKDMEAFMEQIEFLKTVKADREDLEDALADKADACAVTRKVSHDQFDAACDDLSRGIEEALEKLTQQENLWSQALDDIQREIGTKLDKMELGPLRDFINHKLKMLQDRVKALTAMKREQEAAGTKQKLLRDVNCISCDKDVVMRKQVDPATMPRPYSVPATRSMGPYLAYELDTLRKQQKCLPTSKNMHHFESALQGKGETAKDHICNRYCGGSHTVTTAQQRVTRLGHFLTQWGPETIKCSEGQVRGNDGLMYKADLETDSKTKVAPTRPSMLIMGGITEDQATKERLSKKPSISFDAHTQKLEEKRESMLIAKRPSVLLARSGQDKIGQERSTLDRPSSATGDRQTMVADKPSSARISAAAEDRPSTAAGDRPSTAVGDQPSTIGDRPSTIIGDRPSTAVGDRQSTAAGDRPSTAIGERRASQAGRMSQEPMGQRISSTKTNDHGSKRASVVQLKEAGSRRSSTNQIGDGSRRGSHVSKKSGGGSKRPSSASPKVSIAGIDPGPKGEEEEASPAEIPPISEETSSEVAREEPLTDLDSVSPANQEPPMNELPGEPNEAADELNE